MSERLPNREQAKQILIQNGCPPKVISHCIAVANFAVELAQKLQKKGYNINLQLVEAGSMLHDLGRAKTHAVNHSVVGAEIAQNIGLPQEITRIIKRHVGAGITEKEAAVLGWPKGTYIPQTLEEKVVAYADKRTGHTTSQPIEREISRLQKDGKTEAAERVRRLHEEISSMLGETP